MDNSILNKLKDNFEKRNIKVLIFKTFDEIKNYLLKEIPLNVSIGIGNSQTLKSMNLTNVFLNRGNTVYDKELGENKDEVKFLKKKALLSDCYISSTNAVSKDGRIVNIDHSGNRVAALSYGPEKVYIVIGENKITNTQDEAITRARNVAASKNAKRAGFNPPCVELGRCVDCMSNDRVCNIISIIEGQCEKDRLELLIALESGGF